MEPRRERATTVTRAIVHEIRVERLTFMAGSLAYNAFVSMLPLLLLLLAVVSSVGDQRLETGLISIAQAVVTPGAGDVLVSELRNASTGASVLGLVFLVWGTLRVFRTLDTAFSDIYESSAENTFVDKLIDGIVVFASVTAVILAIVTIESTFRVGSGMGVGWLAHRAVLVVGVALALLPMYYVFPDEDGMALREAVPGVIVTAVGLVVFESLFRLYVEYSSTAGRESILASILVFLTWLYFSGLIVLLGAAVNAVLSNRSSDVNVRPVIGGVSHEGGPRGSADGGTRDPVPAIDRLRTRLPTATEVSVVVDGESVALPPPERTDADVETSRLPFVNETVGLHLEWPNAGGESTTEEREEGTGSDRE